MLSLPEVSGVATNIDAMLNIYFSITIISLTSLSGWFYGDPHFVTLDGKNYTFNGVGEYTMVTTVNSTFVLQARTKVAQGGLNIATIFSAGVAKETNTSKVEVRVKDGGTK